jgi:hypothetical protein
VTRLCLAARTTLVNLPEIAMLIKTSLVIAIAALCSAPLAAQTCAGGADGGMDAQGCDCNDAEVAAVFVGKAAADQAAVSPSTDVVWTRAIELYDTGHYADAMADLRVAALHGHPFAADMLALMYRFGERLYGAEVHADAAQAARFTALAVLLRDRRDVAPPVEQTAYGP